MTSRAESAAATGRALVDAASKLLDEGGPDAVTLRAVGSAAGVSRGAPYGHFTDKEDLLTALAVTGWVQMAADLAQLRADEAASSRELLNRAILIFLTVARQRPHLYALMFTTPSHDPQTLITAASGAQDEFLRIVADVVGAENARRTGGLLMTTAHGIAGMEQSGQMSEAKWGASGDQMLHQLIDLLGSPPPES